MADDATMTIKAVILPDDMQQTLKDLNVSDVGEINVDELIGSQVACLSYASTGKYKRAFWSVMSSWNDTDRLETAFAKQVEKGYPKNYKSDKVMVGGEAVSLDDVPF